MVGKWSLGSGGLGVYTVQAGGQVRVGGGEIGSSDSELGALAVLGLKGLCYVMLCCFL